MIWHSPWAFWLSIPILALALLVFLQRRSKISTLQFSNLTALKSMAPSPRTRLMLLPFLLKVAALILLTVALARPQLSDTQVKKNVEGIDIMIALDI